MRENKTHEEIIVEMRFHGQLNIDAEQDKPEFGVLTAEGKIIKNYADQAEAAYKRELGNGAQMRKTLVGIKSLLGSINEITNNDAAAILMNIDLALSAPARNCDVGTWQQQEKRFESFCNRFRHDYCRGCSLGEEFFENHEIGECRLAWAQRKYESEVSK